MFSKVRNVLFYVFSGVVATALINALNQSNSHQSKSHESQSMVIVGNLSVISFNLLPLDLFISRPWKLKMFITFRVFQNSQKRFVHDR